MKWHNFLNGIARLFYSKSPISSSALQVNYKDYKDPQTADIAAILSDWNAVGSDLRYAIGAYKEEECLKKKKTSSCLRV